MIGVFIFTIIAFILGMMLVVVHHLLNKKDLKVEKIEYMLPGYNCGVCGYSGCLGMAEELAKGKDVLKKCKPIKKEEYDKLILFLKSSKK